METDGKGIELIQASARAEYQQVEIGELVFSNKKMEPILHDPHPAAIEVITLAAIKDYLTANVDGLMLAELLLHVETERRVALGSKIVGPNKAREVFIASEVEACEFRFLEFMDPEAFIIGVQTAFVATDTTAALLKIVGNIKEGKERTVTDNGVAQEVQAKVGVQLGFVELPNPVTLAPYRTFREVDQPSSLFILRARAGSDDHPPSLALFPADGNRWRMDAIRNVAEWLRKEIPAVMVLA